jgi:N-acyl homoserine lactone hydrolase
MSTAILTAFTCGWITMPSSFFLAGAMGTIKAPVTVYLIDHAKGLALFDTGFGSRFERPLDTEAQGVIDLDADARIGNRLRTIGVDPADVRWIINSHLHTDHAGGNSDLPNATVVVQQAEWNYALASSDESYCRPEFDLGQPMLKIRGEHDLHGDGAVVLFPSPGHTPGHQCARVRTPTGVAILAADCCNLRRSVDDLRLPEHCFNAEQYMATLKMLRAMDRRGERVFPGDDPDFWANIPQSRPLNLGISQ